MFNRFPYTKQVETKDCGAACLHMICRYYGKFLDVDKIRNVLSVGRSGVSVKDIICASETLQMRAMSFSLTFGELKRLMPLPCIAHWNNNHFVVVYKITHSRVYIADPAIGRVSYSYSDFMSKWAESSDRNEIRRGICIGIEPTVNFRDVISSKSIDNSVEAARYLISYTSPYKGQISQILLVLICITLLTALLPIITQSIIDNGIGNRDIRFINAMLIASVSLGCGLALGRWLQQSVGLYFTVRVKISMLSDYLKQLFQMPMNYFESRTIGSLLQRNYDFDRIEGLLFNSIFNAVLSSLYLVVFGFLLCLYNSTLFLIYILGSMLYVTTVTIFWSVRKKMDIQYYNHLAQNQSIWVEFLDRIADIKSFGYGRNVRRNWENNQSRLLKARIRLLNVDQLQAVVTSLITSSRDAILIYISARSVITGTMTVGMVASVLYIIGQLRYPMSNLVESIISIQLFQVSYSRISDVYKSPIENVLQSTNDRIVSFVDDLRLSGICFRYSPSSPYVLNGVTIIIPKSRITSIVGASGSGKSTLMKIIARLYTPTSGTISIGNLKFSSFSEYTWRRNIGVVTQNSALINDTIANNITMGRPLDSDKLNTAARIANIKWEVEAMTLGYETMIGEKGRGVSEGQKQRLLLARAIYDNPPILILDEITSLLDERNEFNIMTAIRDNLQGKTVIITAHRLSTVKMTDYTIVLKSGRLVEAGTYVQLKNARKEFYNIFKQQLS